MHTTSIVESLTMSQRYRLKEREVKKVLERASAVLGNIDLTFFMKGMEAAKFTPQNEMFLADGVPVLIDAEGEVFPTLLNNKVLEKLPTLIVNMGAVPHLCNGADLMAPGIVNVTGEFQVGAMAVVVDEKFSKPIALVRTLYDSRDLSGKKQGKVAVNIHYVGDRFWEAFKQVKSKA